MLWVLHLASDAGIVVTDYTDDALGELAEHPGGSGEFTRVLLRPRMTITDISRQKEAEGIHQRVHEFCALARSVNFPVACEPVVVGATSSGTEVR
jgi:organic hydroperoxide reductase OsmC/OhrA